MITILRRSRAGLSVGNALAAVAAVAGMGLLPPLGLWAQPSGFSPGAASFQIKFKDEVSPYRVTGVFLLPGETLSLEALPSGEGDGYRIDTETGPVAAVAPGKWKWTAPEQVGVYQILIKREADSDSITVKAFVMVRYEGFKGEYINGYRMGKYPDIPLRKLSIYRPPRGFIEVTAENEDTFISPHFRLKQFVCKQESGYPRYMALKERLVLKLESILAAVNEAGYACSTLHIMSGYRTPYYNHAIGNVKYSRHLWGGAADVFIDENPRDGMMDDLNDDGRIDYRDAAVLYEIIDEMYGKPWYERFIGGLARYKKTPNHGPFVHVDVRGFRARWGD